MEAAAYSTERCKLCLFSLPSPQVRAGLPPDFAARSKDFQHLGLDDVRTADAPGMADGSMLNILLLRLLIQAINTEGWLGADTEIQSVLHKARRFCSEGHTAWDAFLSVASSAVGQVSP